LKPSNINNTLSDNELITLYKENSDKEIIGNLYKRYTRFVFLVSLKYLKDKDESEDAVMQIFEKLFIDLKNHKIDNFKAWLHTVTRNHCLMKLRKNQSVLKKTQEYKIDSENNMESEDYLHLNEKTDDEIKFKNVREAIDGLNNEQQKCIQLFYIESKSYHEVAEITGYTLKNVKSYIQNGKRNLKNSLLKAGISELIIIYILFSI